MAKIGLPDPPAASDSPVPTQQAAIDRDAGVVQVADWRDMPDEEQIVASVTRRRMIRVREPPSLYSFCYFHNKDYAHTHILCTSPYELLKKAARDQWPADGSSTLR